MMKPNPTPFPSPQAGPGEPPIHAKLRQVAPRASGGNSKATQKTSAAPSKKR